VVGLTCGLVGGAGIGVAAAATPTTGLAAVKARAAADISARLVAINGAIPRINANQVITAADRSTLLATLGGDLSGLTGLGQTIATDTTTASASTDAKTIFTTYRVFALAIPQVAYAAATDDVTVAELPALVDAEKGLTAVLSAEPVKNTPAVQAAMADLSHQISAVASATAGLSASVLADTPAQYDANHALLSGPRQTLATAQANVITAKNDVTTVTAALQ
jgi:hypothetical protein